MDASNSVRFILVLKMILNFLSVNTDRTTHWKNLCPDEWLSDTNKQVAHFVMQGIMHIISLTMSNGTCYVH